MFEYIFREYFEYNSFSGFPATYDKIHTISQKQFQRIFKFKHI